VVANSPIIAATVEDLRVDNPEADEAQASAAFVAQLDQPQGLHDTIGVRDEDVWVEAGALVAAFRRGMEGMWNMPLEGMCIMYQGEDTGFVQLVRSVERSEMLHFV